MKKKSAKKTYASFSGPRVIEAVLRNSGREMRIIEIAEDAIKGGFGDQKSRKKIFANFGSFLSRAGKDTGSKIQKVGRGQFRLITSV